MDCDVILRGREWPARAIAALANSPLVQLFSTVYDLRPGLTRVDWSADLAAQSWRSRPSVTQALADGVSIDDTMHRHAPSSSGMAWAARRELLEQHGLYDRCIIGGGDTAIACAAWGRPDLLVGRHRMNGAPGARLPRVGRWLARRVARARPTTCATSPWPTCGTAPARTASTSRVTWPCRRTTSTRTPTSPSARTAPGSGAAPSLRCTPACATTLRGRQEDRSAGDGQGPDMTTPPPPGRFLLVQHHRHQRGFYDVVLDWVAVNLPDELWRFDLRELPVRLPRDGRPRGHDPLAAGPCRRLVHDRLAPGHGAQPGSATPPASPSSTGWNGWPRRARPAAPA
jgi:hypothetical protein